MGNTASQTYRFQISIGWLSHLWKSATRQDHKALRPALQKLLPKDGIAVDVGAHGGQVTRLLAELMPQGVVVSVEPSGYARSVLRLALWARGIQNAIIVAAALGTYNGIATLRTPIKMKGDMGYGLAHIGAGATSDGRRIVTETVVVTTLDCLFAELGLERLDFIKVDIEGYEAAFIAGANITLARFKPVVMMEHNEDFLARAGSSADQLWSEMTDLGYAAHALRGSQLVMIGSGDRENDIFWVYRNAD